MSSLWAPNDVLVFALSWRVVSPCANSASFRFNAHCLRYCSVEHMQTDWPNHRTYCRPHDGTDSSMSSSGSQDPSPVSPYATLNNASDGGRGYPSRSGGSRRRAHSPGSGASAGMPSSVIGSQTTTEFNSVLFPCNEERPRIVRIKCTAQTQASGPTIWTPMPQHELGDISNITSMIITHGIGGAPLRFPLHLFYGTNSFEDGSVPNKAIHRMTAGKATYPWAGEPSASVLRTAVR